MKSRTIFAGVTLVALIVSGCGANMGNTVKPAADVMNATRQTTRGTMNAVMGPGNRMTNRATNQTTNQTSRDMHASTDIANGLVHEGYAKRAFVFVVGDNAYVAIDQGTAAKTDLGTQEKNKISATVKRINKRVKTVYVSANPAAYARFQGFAHDMSAGKPVSAVWDNFRTTISRVFPSAH